MKKFTVVFFSLILFLSTFTSLFAQSKIIEGINFKNFYGVFEIKNNGYFVCYKKNGKTLLEIYNNDLELIGSETTTYKLNNETYFDSRTNDKSFLAIIAKSSRSYKINSYDFNGKKTNSINVKNPIIDIYSVEGKGYFFVVNENKKAVVKFYDNTLKKQWSKIVQEQTNKSSLDLYARSSPTSMNIAAEENLVTSDALFLVLKKSKGRIGVKITEQRLMGISIDGNILFEKDYDPNEKRISNILGADGKIVNVMAEGNYSKPLRPKLKGTLIEVLDEKGNVLESLNPDMKIFALGIDGMPRYVPRAFFKKGNEFIAIGESSSDFLVVKLDEKFNQISEESYFKDECDISGMEAMGVDMGAAGGMMFGMSDYVETLLHRDYRFYTYSEKGELIIVYFHHGKKIIELHSSYSSTNKENSLPIGDTFEEAKSKEKKITVRWYDAFPNEFNKGMYGFYNKKKKQIEMHIIEF